MTTKGVTSGKQAKSTVRKQQATFKLVFDSPYLIKWPQLDDADSQMVLETLQRYMEPTGETAVKGKLTVGVNAVTRALEKGALQLLLVCKSTKTSPLVQHLPTQCQRAGVPFWAVTGLASLLADTKGLNHTLAVGITKDPAGTDWSDIMASVHTHIGPTPPSPWIQGSASYQPVRLKRLQIQPSSSPR